MDTAAIGNSSLSKTITASVKQISPSELSPVEQNINSIPVGSGTYGECVVKQMRRFGIMVIEKKLPKSDLREVMNEAQCMNALTHASIPHLLGVQIEQKPFSLIMQYLGEGMESVTVHKLLHQTLAKKCPSLTMSGFQFYLTSQKLSFMFIKKVFCTVISSLTMFLFLERRVF